MFLLNEAVRNTAECHRVEWRFCFCKIAVPSATKGYLGKNNRFGKKSINPIEFGVCVSRTGGLYKLWQILRLKVHFWDFRSRLRRLVTFLKMPPNFGNLAELRDANLLLNFFGVKGPHPTFIAAMRCPYHSTIGYFGGFRGISRTFGESWGISGNFDFGWFQAFWWDFDSKFPFWAWTFQKWAEIQSPVDFDLHLKSVDFSTRSKCGCFSNSWQSQQPDEENPFWESMDCAEGFFFHIQIATEPPCDSELFWQTQKTWKFLSWETYVRHSLFCLLGGRWNAQRKVTHIPEWPTCAALSLISYRRIPRCVYWFVLLCCWTTLSR